MKIIEIFALLLATHGTLSQKKIVFDKIWIYIKSIKNL